MATTHTNNLDLALVGTGDEVDNWGNVLNNSVFTVLDNFSGKTTSYTVSNTNVSISQTEWQSMAFKLTGTLSANINLVIPLSVNDVDGTLAVGGMRVINNQTTGNFTVTVKTAATGSTGVIAPQGYRTVVASDTTNVNYVSNSTPGPVIQNSSFSATVTTDQNDYAVPASAAYAILNVTVGSQLTGITNGVAGRVLQVFNSGTSLLTLVPNSSSSSSANRFLMNSILGLKAGSGVTLEYDGTASGWRVGAIPSADPPQGLFTALKVLVLTNTTVSVQASNVVVSDGQFFLQTGALNVTLNLGTAGVVNGLDMGSLASGTWYYVYAISNGASFGTLASTSSTAPTLPSGYTYSARIGALRTAAGSAQLMGTLQYGADAQYVVGLAQTTELPVPITGVSGNPTTGSYTAVSLSTIVPPTAGRVVGKLRLGASSGGATTSYAAIAPNGSYGAVTVAGSTTEPPTIIIAGTASNAAAAFGGSYDFDFALESSSVYYACTSPNGFASILGWQDNL